MPVLASARRSVRRRRGFTLVELMCVVAMIGVLAALAVVGFKKYVNASHGADARAIISAIRVAEESYRSETLQYCNASNGVLTNWYPGPPTGFKRVWAGYAGWTNANGCSWQQLNVTVDSPTQYGFAVVSGAPGQAPPVPATQFVPTWPNPTTEPWYVVQAAGDTNSNGVFSYFLSSSFSGEIYAENETE